MYLFVVVIEQLPIDLQILTNARRTPVALATSVRTRLVLTIAEVSAPVKYNSQVVRLTSHSKQL